MKGMHDNEIAVLHGNQTKAIKQQVKRNMACFPDDFRFVLTTTKFESLRTKIVATYREDSRYLPMASSNTEIIRVFLKYSLSLRGNEVLNQEIKNLNAKLDHPAQFTLIKLIC